MEDLIIPIPSSFVRRQLKLLGEKGAGESKLFVGSTKKEDDFDSFFNNFSEENEYFFRKSNLIDYLKYTQVEYIAEKCNQYQDISEDYYNGKVSLVNSQSDIVNFDIIKFTDSSRYYIRATNETKKVFDELFREIALPKITNLKIIKNDFNFEFALVLNYDEIKKRNVEGVEDFAGDVSLDNVEEYRNDSGENILLYGVPGSGKSWTIEHEYCDDEKYMERLVFHPDYMYSDFVGQILPIVKKDDEGKEKVRYEFTPGPFTKILKKAYLNPSNSYYLIIEEINRGNAPAIFGEIFQLLDRKSEDSTLYKKGTSEYGITNDNIAFEVYGDTEKKVRIPANLSIIGTMNTSDQNVFTLDTAFQRRWIMRMIPNSFKGHKFADNKILDTEVSWQQFCEAINEEILRRNNVTSSEDKRLGAYFVSADDLDFKKETDNANEKEKIEIMHKNARFAEKVLKYLWDDAFKFSHSDTFDTKKYKSLEMVIDAFNSTNGNDRFKVFHENLRKLIIEGVDESNVVSEPEED